ncbi:hypothetical protein ABL78_6233 [Leptomonas seymouri]|uniref:Uncharacterized protein n=1 Tax=Leptomonas seymouri TaxID=5684 RepID=A0A0N1IIG1_LEPSE|nr:hypothetical protein ABL78_6233 [Leptomonas seymouri]|eukprot:KPI84711.1 hypothetical protein ABL78_6233 [Leptomonas seymouri]
MDFAFPSFTRASTDLPFSQPPQKSLLELVIEAKGRLGLVPQRKPEKRLPGGSFSAFSESDEESEGAEDGDTPSAGDTTAVLTTRTAWVPPTHLLDYFFSAPFMQSFLALHCISSSRPAAVLAPPLLTVHDAQLHPVVEAALCSAFQGANAYSHSTRSDGIACGRSRAGRGRGGQQRGGGDPSNWGGRGGHGRADDALPNRDAAAVLGTIVSASTASLPLWEVAKLEQLKSIVFGDPFDGLHRLQRDGDAEDTDQGREAASGVTAPLPTMTSAATGTVAQRVLFRGLQQVALPALLLGDHVLLSGPRGLGKRTAVLLAAAANVLTIGTAATCGVTRDGESCEAQGKGEECDQAAADCETAKTEDKTSGSNDEGGPSTVRVTGEEVKQEPTGEALDARGTPADAEIEVQTPLPAEDSVYTKEGSPAPRALLVMSSYADVIASAQWLESVFGSEAFVPYTFQKDDCTLQLLFEDAGAASATERRDYAAAAVPAVDDVQRSPAYLAPPTAVEPLPFITDVAMTQETALPVDPTQAGPVLGAVGSILGASDSPDISELAALVQESPLPLDIAAVPAETKMREVTREVRKRRCRSSSCRSDSNRHRSHRPKDGDRRGRYSEDDSEEDRDTTDDYHSKDRRSSRSHRHRGDRHSCHVSGGSSSRTHHHHRRHRSHRDRTASIEDEAECDHRHHRSSRSGGDRRDGDEKGSSHSRRHHHHRSSSRSGHRRERLYDSDNEGNGRDYYDSKDDSRRHRRRRDRNRSRGSSEEESKKKPAAPSLAAESAEVGPAPRAAAALSVRPPSITSGGEVPGCEAASFITPPTLTPPAVSADAVLSSGAASSTPPAPTAHSTLDPLLDDPRAWLPAVLRQRIPIIITTYRSLQTAMEVVGGEATALPPLEHVRVAGLIELGRALAPPLKQNFSHAWWVSLVNALDVDCQFMATADRSGADVMGFLSSTVIPDAGEHLLHVEQRDTSIWALMDVQLYPVPVVVAAAPTEGSADAAADRRPKISGEDIDAAKLTHLFSLVCERMASDDGGSSHGADADTTAVTAQREEEGHKSGHHSCQGARVVVVCCNRREQSLILTHLSHLFRDQAQDGRAGLIRLTDSAETLRHGGAEVVVLTDAQLADVRVLRDMHQCTQVDLILHFSLPRQVMIQLEKQEIAAVLAQRGRAVLGHSKPFCSRRWWCSLGQPPTAAELSPSSSSSEFAPVKVVCQVMLTEHNMKGRVGACMLEVLSEVSAG